MRRVTSMLAIAGSVTAAVAIGLSASAWASGPPGPNLASLTASPRLVSPRPPARTETSFVPITPCRIVDTLIAGGKLGNGTVRTYVVGGKTGFAPQGGTTGGCGIPISATAIAATVTAPTPVARGFLRTFPANRSEPGATTLSYLGGLSANTGATIPIQSGAAAALKVKNHGGPTHLIIDVSGYYAPPMEAEIAADGTVYAGGSRLVRTQRDGKGEYQVFWDTDVNNCAAQVTTVPLGGQLGFYATVQDNASEATIIDTWQINPMTNAPVLADDFFYVSVSC
jgi:hypothetical protein